MPRKKRLEPVKGVYEKKPRSGIWWIRYTRDGKRKTESIGRRSDAVAIYQQRMTEIRSGVQLGAVRATRGIKFSALVAEALRHSEAEQQADTHNLRQRLSVIEGEFGTRVASSIKPTEIRDWLVKMTLEKKWTNGTWNRYKSAMSLAFRVGLQTDQIQTNPARFVTHKKESSGRLRYLLPDEEVALRKAIMLSRPHCMPQLDIALYTGMRKEEQFTVEWDQVDLKQRFIHLTKTKNGDQRDVPLNEAAIEALHILRWEHKRQKFNFNTIFFDRRGCSIRDPRGWFVKACGEAGIKGLVWHGLRHTFASRLAAANIDLKTIQELLGHRTLAMAARYTHLSKSHLHQALSKLTPTLKPTS